MAQQVLEWKGPVRAGRSDDIEILLLGDSMIRNINCVSFNKKAWLFAYPGITAEVLRIQIQNENLPPPTKIGVIYLHVGTNNVSTLRETKSISNSIHEVQGCISVIRRMYANAVLIVGAILPRLDDQNTRAIELNKAIETYCVDAGDLFLHFVEFWPSFAKEHNPNYLELYRYRDTIKADTPDTVHLNYKGVGILQSLLATEVDKAVKIKTAKKIENTGDLMSNEEWVRFRELQRNKFDRYKARFKVTNYKPALNVRDIFVGIEQDNAQSKPSKDSVESGPDGSCQNVTDMDLESGSDDLGPTRRVSQDLKPLPDIIPSDYKMKDKNRSDSESPRPMTRRDSQSPMPRRRPSADGDVSSFTDPSDREHSKLNKKEKWSPLKSVHKKQIQMTKVKKSIRERSSRRGRDLDTRESSSSPERDSVKSDKSLPKSFRRSSRGSSNHEKWNERSPGKNKRGRSSRRKSNNSDIPPDDPTKPTETKSSRLIDEISRELLSEKSVKSRQVSVAKSARSAHKQSEVNRKALEKAQRKKAKWDLEHRKSSAASIDAVARARNISIEEEKKERNAKRKRTTPDDEKPEEKVQGIVLERRASMVSESSDKIFEDFLKEDVAKVKKKVAKEEEKEKVPAGKYKREGFENDLKAKLLEKQKARKKKEKTDKKKKPSGYSTNFYTRLFLIIGIPKSHTSEMSAKFFDLKFTPSSKNFKSISIFDFGVKFGVKLQFRAKIKSITDEQIKQAMTITDDLREKVLQTTELIDSDLSDSQF